jgi:hypothetical protein
MKERRSANGWMQKQFKIIYYNFTDHLSAMKKFAIILLFTGIFLFLSFHSSAQCSICTKTAQQLGEKPAKGLNEGILYLAATPFLIAGIVFYKWKKSNHTS